VAREPAAAPATDSAAPRRTATPRPWSHETSDIPVDPRIRFGAFDNGLRWAWAANSEPKDRCYVRLHVDVGSLGENDDELGMAHFLEHMAFNGTKNFAAGTLIEWFQSHGMAFGADTNAHTSFSETVYKLDLPRNDPKTLREGLLVLRDFADGMIIAEEEVQAEKGVIDGEQRERDSAGFRVLLKQLELAFGGTRVGNRIPIGTKEVRDNFTAASVRAFYERWYRPEHMTLVAVGDFGGLDPVELFREAFGDMPVPAAPLTKEPGPGTAKKFDLFYSVYEKEIPSVQITVARLKPWKQSPVTVKEWLSDLPLDYARAMLNSRYSEMLNKGTAPFLNAGVSSGEAFDVFDGEDLSISSTPEKWKESLAAAEQELRRAIEFGFHEGELAEMRADAFRSLDEAVQREATNHSQAILGTILAVAESPGVPTDAKTRRNLLRPAIEALTIEACHQAFKKAWSEGSLSITTTGNLDLGADAGTVLRAAFEASRAVAVESGPVIATSEFAYASDPAKSGAQKSRSHVEDLDIHQVVFENGVMLNVKRTDFKEKQILMTVNVGEGNLTLDPSNVLAAGMVGAQVVNNGGLAAHTVDDLRRLLAGKQVGFGFGMGADRFSAGGATTGEDLLLQCELATAFMTAPGWREESLAQFRSQVPLIYEQMKHQLQGPLVNEFIPAVFSGDPRFGYASREQVDAWGVEETRDWLAPIFADAPIEISLVGDVDVEAAIGIVARTFGTLPARRAWNEYAERRTAPAPKGGIRQTHTIETQDPKSLVFIAFPANDGIPIERRRAFDMLNEVIRDRLRLEVREKLGAAYSPGSAAQVSTVYPGVGMLFMQAQADPEKVETLVSACLGVADTLAKDGISDEELDRLREPVLNRRRDAKRTNGFWLQILSRAQSDPDHLDDMRSGDHYYESVKAADLTPLAKQYLQSARASVLVVNPAPVK
jgi:zinc protease